MEPVGEVSIDLTDCHYSRPSNKIYVAYVPSVSLST